jgi:hypothetical protein
LASSRKRVASSARQRLRGSICLKRRRRCMGAAPCSREAGAQLAFSSPITAPDRAVTPESRFSFCSGVHENRKGTAPG